MKQRLRILALMLCATICVGIMAPKPVYAASGDQTCTTFAELQKQAEDTSKPGILTNITQFLKDVIGTASQNLFTAFTDSSIYQDAVNAAIVLMIIFYGVGFLIGIVQANFAQVLTRLVKVGIIYALISPGGWGYFNDYVVHFFNDGTDQIIGKVISIGTGTTYDPAVGPFTQLDGIGKFMLSPDMVIGILGATLNGGPYGFLMGGLIGFAMMGVIKLFIQALKLYATAFVVRSLLIGVAPIFIVMMLFERTKQLFSGWVNVMVFLTLQPILFFTFISFFIVMMFTSATSMMGGNELCWTEYKTASGTQNKISFWRFKDKDGQINIDDQTWSGPLSCLLNDGKDANGKPCKPFPINIVDLLSFLLLIYIASKFGDVVNNIATEISNSFVNLEGGARMSLEQSKNLSADPVKGSGINQPPPGTSRMGGTTRKPGA